MAATRHDAFASTSPGCEPLLADEMRALGLQTGRTLVGGVEFRGGDRDVYLATMKLRLATRVVVRISSSPVKTLPGLEAAAEAVPWADWFPDIPDMKVSAVRSRIFHTGAITERMVTAAANAIPFPKPATDAVAIVRIEDDVCVVSACAAGERLDRRGWRGATGKAPLRPTLAAALLRASGWDERAPLVDPMCGGGTIAVEAARATLGIPAHVSTRTFAFQQWPRFAPGTWGSVQASIQRRSQTPARIVAGDRDTGAVQTANTHVARAEVGTVVDIHHAALGELPLPEGDRGWIVTNPPWGGRIGGGDLRDLYAALGNLLDRRPGWTLAFLTTDPTLARATGRRVDVLFRTTTGGRRVTAYRAT